MSNDNSAGHQPAKTPPRWQPIGAIDRRVLGVLAEKAKTTPDAYPMSVNAIRTGCNQKSNRSPVMQLEAEDVEESLERLRNLGAVGVIEGYGRVPKYRHYLYEWLGVDKVELAVVAELLLRGAQTEGELRGRAARMDPIPDLTALRPILAALKARKLVIPLTPEGRGHVVTHALYQPRELENLRTRYAQGPPVPTPAAGGAPQQTPQAGIPSAEPPGVRPRVADGEGEAVRALRREIDELRSRLTQLQSDQDELSSRLQHAESELHQLKQALGG